MMLYIQESSCIHLINRDLTRVWTATYHWCKNAHTRKSLSLSRSLSLSLPITESYAPRFSPSELISNLYIFLVMTRQHESWGSSIFYIPPNPRDPNPKQRYFLRHGACEEICGTSLQFSFGQSNGQSLFEVKVFGSSPAFLAFLL